MKCEYWQSRRVTEEVTLLSNLAKKERKGKPTVSIWIFYWQNKNEFFLVWVSYVILMFNAKYFLIQTDLALTSFGSKFKNKEKQKLGKQV